MAFDSAPPLSLSLSQTPYPCVCRKGAYPSPVSDSLRDTVRVLLFPLELLESVLMLLGRGGRPNDVAGDGVGPGGGLVVGVCVVPTTAGGGAEGTSGGNKAWFIGSDGGGRASTTAAASISLTGGTRGGWEGGREGDNVMNHGNQLCNLVGKQVGFRGLSLSHLVVGCSGVWPPSCRH